MGLLIRASSRGSARYTTSLKLCRSQEGESVPGPLPRLVLTLEQVALNGRHRPQRPMPCRAPPPFGREVTELRGSADWAAVIARRSLAPATAAR